MKRNVASQIVGCQMTTAADGSDFTGAVSCYVTGNGGTQGAGGGSVTHEGNGYHTYTPTQAETNYDHVAFTFKAAGAITATVQVYPSFPQTGDNFALIGTTGSGLTSLATQASVNTIDDFLDTEIAAIKAKTDVMPDVAAIADAVWDEAVAGHLTAGSLGSYASSTLTYLGSAVHGLPALKILIDTIDDLLDTEVAAIKSDTAAILIDTAEIGAAGAGLTAIPWGASWSGAAAAGVWNAATASYGISGSYGELIETNLDAAVSSVSGGGGGSGVADWTANQKTAIMAILGIPASGTTPEDPTTGILDTIRDAATAIKAKTDNLPADPADASDIAASFTTLTGKVDTIDDFLDTEIAAIKAKTDLIPADPADASDIAASFATVNTKLDTIDDLIDTEIGAIKTETASIQADTNDIQARLPAALIGGRMDVSLSAIDNSTTALAAFKRAVKGNVVGTVGVGSTTTSIVTSALTPPGSVADKFKGRILTFADDTTTANLRGQSTDITANTSAAAPTLTVTALTTPPVSTDTFSIT